MKEIIEGSCGCSGEELGGETPGNRILEVILGQSQFLTFLREGTKPGLLQNVM
jgi:hypothetical protein